MELLLAVLIIVIGLMIIIGIILLIVPWVSFMFENYLDWCDDKQDEIIAKRNEEKE